MSKKLAQTDLECKCYIVWIRTAHFAAGLRPPVSIPRGPVPPSHRYGLRTGQYTAWYLPLMAPRERAP